MLEGVKTSASEAPCRRVIIHAPIAALQKRPSQNGANERQGMPEQVLRFY